MMSVIRHEAIKSCLVDSHVVLIYVTDSIDTFNLFGRIAVRISRVMSNEGHFD